MAHLSCLNKQNDIKETFSHLKSQEEKYHYIIEMGRKAPKMPLSDQTEDRLVVGCQSLLYLQTKCNQNCLSLQVGSNALISAGLAHLLIQVYNGEPPLAVFECPPLFLKEIGLFNLLSPSRSNGLKALYQKLQKDCLQFLKGSSL